MEDYKAFFSKLRKHINKQRRVIVQTRDGKEADITDDLSDAILHLMMKNDEMVYQKQLIEKNTKINTLVNELIETKKQLYKAQKAKKLLDDKLLRYELFMDSDEGKMTDKLVKKHIDDPDIQPYKEKMEKLKDFSVDEKKVELSDNELRSIEQDIKDMFG
jgi:hypothetical protein